MKFLNRHLHTIVLAMAFAAILALWLCHPSRMQSHFPDKYAKLEPGTYGDMYGSLNTLFSGLAFSLLIYTALLQRSELKQQREELETTRTVFEKQTEIQDKQLKMLKEESERRLELEKISNSPKLMLRNLSWGGRAVSVTLINGGAPIFDLKALDYEPKTALSCVISSDAILDRNAATKIDFHFQELPHDISGTYSLLLSYRDVLDIERQTHLSITYSKNS